MNNAPSQILQKVLTEASGALFTMSADAGAWPLYVSTMPDAGVDNVGCVRDTQGEVMGRLLASGTELLSYGLQLEVRGFGYDTVYALASQAAESLQSISWQTVTVGANTYRIDTIRQTSPVVSMGQDERRRARVSVNFLLMLLDE